jgi:putative transposase
LLRSGIRSDSRFHLEEDGTMWTAEHRKTYVRGTTSYPSNLTDEEWAVLSPLIPSATPGGRPRKTDMRTAMNAILYLLRTGCPWRYLPRDGFPARSTVYNIFRKFQREGSWEAIWAALHPVLREREGREASPTAGVIDSQTLKSAEKGGAKRRNQPPTRQTPWDMTQARR